MISSRKAGLSLRVIVACLVFISFIIEESPKAAAPAQVRLAPCLINDPLTVFRNTIKSSLLHNHDLRKLVPIQTPINKWFYDFKPFTNKKSVYHNTRYKTPYPFKKI